LTQTLGENISKLFVIRDSNHFDQILEQSIICDVKFTVGVAGALICCIVLANLDCCLVVAVKQTNVVFIQNVLKQMPYPQCVSGDRPKCYLLGMAGQGSWCGLAWGYPKDRAT
jgi:hypothetical protein